MLPPPRPMSSQGNNEVPMGSPQPQAPTPPPTQGGALDPTVVNLAKAIRNTESGGNFNAKGKSGEHGAYQFMPETWNSLSQKYLGQNVPLEQATPEQQNEVAYKHIADLKAQGNNVGQIASIWNSGKPNWQGNVGTNSKGVHYDTPQYVDTVAKTYQAYKAGQDPGPIAHTTSTVDPNDPNAEINGTNQSAQTPQDQPTDPNFANESTTQAVTKAGLNAGVKSIENLPSSFLNLGKGLFNAVAHPIKTGEGILNAGVGAAEEGFSGLTGGGKIDNNQTKTFDSLVGSLKDRYGSMENLQKTATNDPAGFGADVLTVLEGGAGALDLAGGNKIAEAGRLAENAKLMPEATNGGVINVSPKGEASALPVDTPQSGIFKQTLDKGIGAVTKPIMNAGASAFSLPYKAATEAMGGFTGVGGDALRAGVDASKQGGEASKAFLQGLRGNITPEQLVENAKSALSEVENNRSTTYQKMLSGLKADPSTYDISPVVGELENQLQKFGITKNEDGTLNFDRSTIADGADANKIQNIYNDIKSWGTQEGDKSALGIDTLKRRIGNYYSPTSDVRAFVQSLKGKTRGVLENAPGYSDTMKKYADMSDNISEIKKGLSLGDKVSIDTSFRKLTSSLRQNNEFRRQLVQELDQATGGKLIHQIAGQQMSALMPRGLAGITERGFGIHSAVTGTGILPLLGVAIGTSPRIVGEVIHALGLGAQGTKYVTDFLSKKFGSIPPDAILAGNANNRLNP